jgi:hypothetical protein
MQVRAPIARHVLKPNSQEVTICGHCHDKLPRALIYFRT